MNHDVSGLGGEGCRVILTTLTLDLLEMMMTTLTLDLFVMTLCAFNPHKVLNNST